jgi:hypothetical protein
MYVLAGAAANLASTSRASELTPDQRSRLMRLSDRLAIESDNFHREMNQHDL